MRFKKLICLGLAFSLTSFCTAVIGPSLSKNAASPSLADVRAAITNAKAGDTVVIPEGSAIWDEQLIITKPINIIGAGIDKTIIQSRYTSPGGNVVSEAQWLVVYRPSDPSADEPFRLSGFSFSCNNSCYGIFLSNPTLHEQTKVRIDHTKITDTTHANAIYGPIYGVADNNEWHAFMVATIFSLDKSIWSRSTFRPGTAENFYYEDNILYIEGGISNSGWAG